MGSAMNWVNKENFEYKDRKRQKEGIPCNHLKYKFSFFILKDHWCPPCCFWEFFRFYFLCKWKYCHFHKFYKWWPV